MNSTSQPRKRQPGWLLALTLVLAAGFLYLAARRVDWNETLTTLSGANLILLFSGLFVFSLSCLARGLRWRVLLSVEKVLPPATVFWSMMVGYLGNAYLPARAGEIIRSVMVGQRGGISKSLALATALTERIADAVILVAASAVALSTMPELPVEMLKALRVMAVVGAVGAAGVFIAPHLHGLLHKMITHIPGSPEARKKIGGVVDNFLLGAGALQHIGRLGMFVFYSIVLWSLDTITGLLIARSLGLALNPAQIFVLLAALGIASAIPSTPGYVGVYQFVAVNVLVPFGLNASQAMAFILAFQGTMYIGITLWGLIGLWDPSIQHRFPFAEP